MKTATTIAKCIGRDRFKCGTPKKSWEITGCGYSSQVDSGETPTECPLCQGVIKQVAQ